jgi:serine carboxypeptidase 1
VYNFLDGSLDSASANAPTDSSPSTVQAMMNYSRYLSGQDSDSNTIGGIMNGVIKEKLKIIPKDLKSASLSHRHNALCML